MLLLLSLTLVLLGQPLTDAGAALPVLTGLAMAMPRRPVQSGSIASIGYAAQTQTLEVEFKNGSVYQYFGVPAAIYQGLMTAESHGHYLDRYVKKGGYRYREML